MYSNAVKSVYAVFGIGRKDKNIINLSIFPIKRKTIYPPPLLKIIQTFYVCVERQKIDFMSKINKFLGKKY